MVVATTYPDQDDSHSFWYPQHGGVYILNDTTEATLNRAFSVFERHLCNLMGLERNALEIGSSEEFVLDKLTMQHMQLEYMEASNTLEQLKRLVDSNPSMPVPKQLALQIDTVIEDLKSQSIPPNPSKSNPSASPLSLNERFKIVKEARHFAEKLFFAPEMLPRSYYPKEHKLGVYGPLFFPVLIPIFAAVARYLKWG